MNTLFNGVAWSVATTISIRAASFAAQIVLGILLTKEDFGIYGIALSLSAMLSALSNGGTQQILIKRWREYEALAPKITFIALAFNIFSGSLLILIGWYWSKKNGIPQLEALTYLMVAAAIVMTPVLTIKARLAIDHRFREASLVTGIPGASRHLLVIACGFSGFGVLSFSIPTVAEAILALLLASWFVREIPKASLPSTAEFREIFRDTKWQMVNTFSASMSLYGQFLLVGLYVETASLGSFVFSMQLIQAVSVVMMVAISDVIYPKLVKISERNDSNSIFWSSYEICILAAIALATMVIAVAGPSMTFIWGEKWSDAIILTQLLTVILVTNTARTIQLSILAAKGEWAKQTILQLASIAADFIALICFSRNGNLTEICSALISVRLLTTIAGSAYIFLNRSPNNIKKTLLSHIYLIPFTAYLISVIKIPKQLFPIELQITLAIAMLIGFTYCILNIIKKLSPTLRSAIRI